ncbi:GNAT family N-acetyltransferase [uncultured Corynebacterium sp.]|uniref:GNAT family N-acetyltransferase n=1 Tax=uncultured Corynebacterium sp. TaxID=159447 RepID=UPI0025E1008F|nr:GNAT family N-acetyltransferase [uncultured Corynebacterium sp.]
MSNAESPVFRLATWADRPLIRRFHELADAWDDEPAERTESFEKDEARYVDQWSAETDGGIIVEVGGDTVGGAWLRHFTEDNPGWGYVADEYPEVAIALEPGYTGRGLGGELMRQILEFARERGATGVCLSVEVGNARAIRSYEKVGFGLVGDGDDGAGGYTMLYRF